MKMVDDGKAKRALERLTDTLEAGMDGVYSGVLSAPIAWLCSPYIDRSATISLADLTSINAQMLQDFCTLLKFIRDQPSDSGTARTIVMALSDDGGDRIRRCLKHTGFW
jgi:hypothetical protein